MEIKYISYLFDDSSVKRRYGRCTDRQAQEGMVARK